MPENVFFLKTNNQTETTTGGYTNDDGDVEKSYTINRKEKSWIERDEKQDKTGNNDEGKGKTYSDHFFSLTTSAL